MATTAIKQAGSVATLNKLQGVCDLHDVKSDEPWALDGAAVRVSIICGAKTRRNSLLTTEEMKDAVSKLLRKTNDVAPSKIKENKDICFEGFALAGCFNIEGYAARKMLARRGNVNKRPNSDVIRPLKNGRDIVGIPRDEFVIDFGRMSEKEASFYEVPFAYTEKNVKVERQSNNRESRRARWWQFGETRPGLRSKTAGLKRQLCVLKTSKYRIFTWIDVACACDGSVNIITMEDDLMLGCLHNRYHEAWALMMGGKLEDRPRYTPTTTFETYPFPDGLSPDMSHAERSKSNNNAESIANAAMSLHVLRNAWLFPEELVSFQEEVVAHFPKRAVPNDAAAALEMRTRTLTNLYNQQPAWLTNAHEELDAAVAHSYGWPENISIEEALGALLEINKQRHLSL